MPAVRNKVTPREGRIEKALEALRSSDQKSAYAAYKAFNMLYKKLLGRYKRRSKASHGGHNKALDNA